MIMLAMLISLACCPLGPQMLTWSLLKFSSCCLNRRLAHVHLLFMSLFFSLHFHDRLIFDSQYIPSRPYIRAYPLISFVCPAFLSIPISAWTNWCNDEFRISKRFGVRPLGPGTTFCSRAFRKRRLHRKSVFIIASCCWNDVKEMGVRLLQFRPDERLRCINGHLLSCRLVNIANVAF